MEFCAECGSMMKSATRDGIELWVCGQCGHEAQKEEAGTFVLAQEQEESEIVDVSDAEDRGLPTTEVNCPNCGNDRAYWYLQQIRSADESETRFFVCTDCEQRWREDDH